MHMFRKQKTSTPQPRLESTFVRTGDARCPLVAVWTLAALTPPASTDDPSIASPVMGALRLLWRAVDRPLISLSYRTV